MDRTVSVIGAGRIGRGVIAFLRATPHFQLSRVLTRGGPPDTADPDAFLAAPAGLIIETAGPGALRAFGPQALAKADLWTVCAGALADDAFRRRLEEVAEAHGTRLRLFSPWFAGIGHGADDHTARLHIRAARPGLGASWSGSLREAITLFPYDLNSAVAAALCGPGLDATSVELLDSGAHGAHRIDTELVTATGRFMSNVVFHPCETEIHPTAASIVGALRSDLKAIQYG
ncbi:L-aspartate dehydrogenase [Defluviimonas aquaemixtae]|uniref:L-aspartate dehydrogenase n=1 Tax=Albidovulum aquaemixtae TaxID=1542388 RepID=A0A2R8B4N4_9RHOB|nr:aspartate dehydrogenase domain-containing protein [Defluviimonas aquaemixtae]SPH17532.1 L-aspartate dehydrogenase [Defluviimonas aquaemixtae]